MKRKLSTSKIYGFCEGDSETYYLVKPSKFQFFENCDESIVLCSNPECKFKSDGVIHPFIPKPLQSIKMSNFVRFINDKNSLQDIDFKIWKLLLDFLGAKPIYSIMLQQYCFKFESSVSNWLSAWQAFGIVCPKQEVINKVPKIIDNIDFFMSHDRKELLIPMELDITKSLFFPNELLELLDVNHTVIQTSCFMKNYKFRVDDAIQVLFLNDDFHQLSHVCKILTKYKYIIMEKDDEIVAFPPSGLYSMVYLTKWKCNLQGIMEGGIHFESCIISLNQTMTSVQTYHTWLKGVDFKELQGVSSFWIQHMLEIGVNIRDCPQDQIVKSQKFFTRKRLRQNADLSELENQLIFEHAGYKKFADSSEIFI